MSNYTPNPLAVCESPTPCPDPCATEAVRLGRQTQILPCIVDPSSPPDDPVIVNLNTSLVAYWKMEEESGAGSSFTRYDSAGAYHLTPFYNTNRVTGRVNFATGFTGGLDEYLYNNDIIFNSDGAPLSIAGWVNMQGTSIDQTIVGNALPSLPVGWRVWYRAASNRIVFSISSGGTEYNAISSTPVVIGTWYHFVGTIAQTEIKLYTNNSVVTTATPNFPDDTSPSFRVGSDLDDNILTGYVDELSFWKNRVLSSADAGYLYNGGAGMTYPF